ncbi:DUF3274 domain-containing protein [Ralstonia mannitolilytica]|uniref:T6SS effector phospholipase Tle3 domain-containing protein n=1 Tax=Ralstonia mannitolilytica TaxID=105219 RepID=UPI000CEDE8AC|nr:DUF3274 domain-containing protein [Ralstonia mannitolilytica]MBU9580571.1 DUF3274 domain-containing protein [Ralstonia mannitolilytica]
MTDSTGTLSCGPRAEALCLPGNPRLDVEQPLPLPGVIIFVHGVNSMGEWFDDSELGLLAGLNARLQRNDDQVHAIKGSGQLRPASYMGELTEDGYIHRDLKSTTFIQDAGYSPIIRFRWGYKASQKEIATVGGSILLDETDAWGGGPFANGCSALPDMFGNGTDTGLFLGLAVQDMNTSDRQVYSCPARHYQAFAAWRLAKLVARIREIHRAQHEGMDCPITVVCHSQGNMIGLGSAYFGANHPDLNGLGVADNYVLANAPYSVQKSGADNYAQYNWPKFQGRVKYEARIEGLKNFFDIVRNFKPNHYDNATVDAQLWNSNPKCGSQPCTTAQDQAARQTRKRVFLYCNPHDRVISIDTVKGMGWLGLSNENVTATGAQDILFQRVWAEGKPGQPYKVGASPGTYFDYWNHTTGADRSENQFWTPRADRLRMQIEEIWGDDRRSVIGKANATVWGFVFQVGLWIGSAVSKSAADLNGRPADDWKVCVNAPEVPCKGIEPKSLYLASSSWSRPGEPLGNGDRRIKGPFNRYKESATDSLNPNRTAFEGEDAYAEQRKTMGHGDAASEAAMRYDQNAGIRQKARRAIYTDGEQRQLFGPAGLLNPWGFDENDVAKMNGQDHGGIKGTNFEKFEKTQRMGLLAKGADQQATNHSTILTNPEHSEHVLAYDVDVGLCQFSNVQMNQLRRMADWRWCEPKEEYGDYFPPGRDADKDIEFEYYQTALLEKEMLSKNKKFDPEKGALSVLKIEAERNWAPVLQSQHRPKNSDSRYT